MKKFLAIILAAVMVFAMAGAVMAEEPDAEAPAVDFEWNGQKEVWAILPTAGVPGLLVHADSMGYTMEELGWTYAVKAAEDEGPAKQVEYVNDAIAAGNVGALMIAAMDVPMLEDVCGQAREAGIAICMLGVAPEYPIAGYIATSYEMTGEYAVKAAEDWVTKRVEEGGNIPTDADGKYEVAVDYYTDITDGIYRSNAIFGTIEASDNLVAVSATQAYGNSAFTDAYDNAQTALAAHPDCRVFIAYEPDEAMGIAEAISDYALQNGLDLADFGVFPCYDVDDAFQSMWAAVQEDPSANAIKGFSTYGGYASEEDDAAFHAVEKYANDMTMTSTGQNLANILLGVTEKAGEWTYGDMYFDDISAKNIYGLDLQWKQGDENTAEQYRVDNFMY